MKASLLRQKPEDLPGAFAGVDDAERLFRLRQPRRQFFVCPFSLLLERDSAEKVEQLVRIRGNFPKGQFRGQLLENLPQFRLGRGAENRRRAVMPHQLPDGGNAGFQVRHRQGLRLVKNHHAVCQMMQLAAAGGFRGVQGLKKLHGRGDDHRRVPVFAGQTAAARLRRFRVARFVGELRLAVVFQNVFFSQNFRKDLGVLLDDAGVGNDVNNPFHPVADGMGKGKSQRRNGFPAAGGHGQGKKSLFLLAALQAAPQDVVSFGAQLGFGFLQPWGHAALQLFPQRFQRRIAAPGLRPLQGVFRIQKVRVHQTGKQHPGIHRLNAPIPAFFRPLRHRRRASQNDLLFPC